MQTLRSCVSRSCRDAPQWRDPGGCASRRGYARYV